MSALTIPAKADAQIALIVCKGGQQAGVGMFEAFHAPHITD